MTVVEVQDFGSFRIQYKEGIHESTVLRFLPFVFAFLQNAIHEQSRVFSIDLLFCMDFCNHTAVWFSISFPPFCAFLIVVSMGKRCIYMLIKCNKRRNKPKPPPTFSWCCRNLQSKKTIGGSKIRWWRWLWIAWSKSLKIFFPITSENYPVVCAPRNQIKRKNIKQRRF